MIKIENVEVVGLEHAIRGMRNPKNSWDRSDSGVYYFQTDKIIDGDIVCYPEYVVGDNDLGLMKKLEKGGPVHAKYRRMIVVYLDITAPLYWWSEYDTYKVGTVANSCSKMHKLLEKSFEMSDFSFDKLPGYKNEIKQFKPMIDDEMIDKEVWVYYDKDYDFSNYGRVRRKLKNKDRIISGSLHKDGYVFVTLHGKQYPLHRIVAKLFYPDLYSEDLVVNHIDGNKQNNFSNNLEWVTQKENIRHSYQNDLQPKISKTYTGKFSDKEREEIKKKWENGDVSKRELARVYGVSHTCINDIINEKYKYAQNVNLYEEVARPIVDLLNELRDSWITTQDAEEKKKIWYSIIQLLPSSYNQKRTIMLNYEVLVGIYKWRHNHKLDEWVEFCKWIEKLPYSEIITGN